MARRASRKRSARPRTRGRGGDGVKIECSAGVWLDGYDGQAWETTTNFATAWRLDPQEAIRKLERVINQFPNAKIVGG